jgi:hypothetical protein
MAATPTLFLPQRTLIKDDLPTFGYPTVPTNNLYYEFLPISNALCLRKDSKSFLVKILVEFN